MYRLDGVKPSCADCRISCGRATFGQIQSHPSTCILIIISAYPGYHEGMTGISLSNPYKKPGVKGDPPMNAGGFLRSCLREFFDKDPEIPDRYKPLENHTFFTNVIKCNPQKGKDKLTISPKDISTCVDRWLIPEIEQFSDQVPILLAASEAVKGVMGQTTKLYTNTNRVLNYGNHPVIISPNPIEWERGSLKLMAEPNALANIEQLFRYAKKSNVVISKRSIEEAQGKVRSWAPPPVGSVMWHVRNHLSLLKVEVKKYIESREG